MMTRRYLPNRRPHETFALEFGGQSFRVGLGRFDDGSPAEAFVSATKAGSSYDSLARDAGILLSIALQAGADLPTIRHGLTRESDGSPASLLGAVVDAMEASR